MSLTPLPVCWSAAAIPRAVTLLAKVGDESADYFLATHSPIQGIIGEKGFERRPHREDELYERLMTDWTRARPGRDLSVLIRGEAGTGKSHLINWLKLRLDDGLRRGEQKNVRPVLVRRRSGSLKDALTQLIEQLGGEFGQYLQPVHDALSKLSPETARHELRLKLSLELGPKRADRGRKPLKQLNRYLEHLGDACAARGFGGWLGRADGVLDRNVRLLNDGGGATERERPRFTADDLARVPPPSRKPQDNSGDVLQLVDELEDDEHMRGLAAGVLNEALDDALAEMTGLSGGNLDTIFTQIRRNLHAQGHCLALFIEDVSAMSVLDLEVVKAVEPRQEPGLCALLAVMGVTDAGWDRLRENDRQRISHTATVGSDAVKQWSQDSAGLASFSARYLNALRLKPDQITRVAADRRAGRDVTISGCDGCKYNTDGSCHAAFGKATLDGVDVGLYPLSAVAPGRLLAALEENEAQGIQRTPRGFLMHLFVPIVQDTAAVENEEFPHQRALQHVVRTDPPYWTTFVNRYCGDWFGEQTDRLRLLTQFWLPEAPDAERAAAALAPLCKHLGYPEFSRKVAKPKSGGSTDGVGPFPIPSPPPPPPTTTPTPAKLTKLVAGLRAWLDNGELRDDKEPRELIADLMRHSVPWDDYRHPPVAEWRRLVRTGYEFVRLEGQRSRPVATRFFIDLPRTEETRSVIEALARFTYEGGGTNWDFSGGELHKRVVSRWVRKYTPMILAALQPPELPVAPPVVAAARLLAVAAVLRNRGELPDGPADRLAAVLAPLDALPRAEAKRVVRFDPVKAPWSKLTQPPDSDLRNRRGGVVLLAPEWQALAEDLFSRHDRLREFVFHELAVVQGRTGGVVTIDARPVLDAIAGPELCSIEGLDAKYWSGFWESRYTALTSVSQYSKLLPALEAERIAVLARRDAVLAKLKEAGYEGSARTALEGFLTDVRELIEAKKKANFLLPDGAFDELVKSKALADRLGPWATALESADALTGSTGLTALVAFDARNLLDLEAAIDVTLAHLSWVEEELNDTDSKLAVDGDPDVILNDLSKVLDALVGDRGGDAADTTEGTSDDTGERADGADTAIARAEATEEPSRPDAAVSQTPVRGQRRPRTG